MGVITERNLHEFSCFIEFIEQVEKRRLNARLIETEEVYSCFVRVL